VSALLPPVGSSPAIIAVVPPAGSGQSAQSAADSEANGGAAPVLVAGHLPNAVRNAHQLLGWKLRPIGDRRRPLRREPAYQIAEAPAYCGPYQAQDDGILGSVGVAVSPRLERTPG
jgi:hypothetical protein